MVWVGLLQNWILIKIPMQCNPMQFIFICAMHNHHMICFTSLLWTFFMFIINFHVHLVDLDVHIPRISQSKASSLLESISSFLLLPLILLLLFPFLFYSFLFLFAIQKLFSLMFYLNFCQVFCLFSSAILQWSEMNMTFLHMNMNYMIMNMNRKIC